MKSMQDVWYFHHDNFAASTDCLSDHIKFMVICLSIQNSTLPWTFLRLLCFRMRLPDSKKWFVRQLVGQYIQWSLRRFASLKMDVWHYSAAAMSRIKPNTLLDVLRALFDSSSSSVPPYITHVLRKVQSPVGQSICQRVALSQRHSSLSGQLLAMISS